MSPGERIKKRRVDLGLTQAELALRAGVKQPALSHIETGATRNLRSSTMAGIAKALHTTTEWIMHGRGTIEVTRSEDGATLLSFFEQLTETNRAAALATVEALLKAQAPQEDRRLIPDRRQDKNH
jgi:transcriptional regulator with XRE-family HTH domain